LTTVENVAMSNEPTGDRPAYFAQLAATVEECGRLRWALGQVVTLADDAPRLSDEQLRDRLLALADRARLAQRP
jgi:hypothetical protein